MDDINHVLCHNCYTGPMMKFGKV